MGLKVKNIFKTIFEPPTKRFYDKQNSAAENFFQLALSNSKIRHECLMIYVCARTQKSARTCEFYASSNDRLVLFPTALVSRNLWEDFQKRRFVSHGIRKGAARRNIYLLLGKESE